MKIRLTRDHPKYARLRAGLVVEAEPITEPPGLMRVKDFGPHENGALVRGEAWELVLEDEDIRAFVRDD